MGIKRKLLLIPSCKTLAFVPFLFTTFVFVTFLQRFVERSIQAKNNKKHKYIENKKITSYAW